MGKVDVTDGPGRTADVSAKGNYAYLTRFYEPTGTDGNPVDISAIFDGWGYVHQYNSNTMQKVDTYALPESQDAAYASDFGDLSVHEVATDPDKTLPTSPTTPAAYGS